MNDELLRLAEQLETRAIDKLTAYVGNGERNNIYDGSDRLDDAEKLLSCAAALRYVLHPSKESDNA